MLSGKQIEYVIDSWKKRRQIRKERKECKERLAAAYREYERIRQECARHDKELRAKSYKISSVPKMADELGVQPSELWKFINGFR